MWAAKGMHGLPCQCRPLYGRRAVIALAMPAAVATATEACRLSSADEVASWLLYSSAREVSAFDKAAAAAASSALRRTASKLEASLPHVRRTGPSEAAEVPSLQPCHTL